MKARVGILCNSDSGRVRSRMPEVRALCRRIAGASYVEVDGATLDGPLVPELLSQQPVRDAGEDRHVRLAAGHALHAVDCCVDRRRQPAAVSAELCAQAARHHQARCQFARYAAGANVR